MSVVQDKHLHAASVHWSPSAATAEPRLAWRTAADRDRPTTTATTTNSCCCYFTLLLTAYNDKIYIIVDNEISQIGTKLTKYCCFGK